MINVSDEFKEVLANGGKLYMTVDVEYPDGTTDVWDDEIMQGQNIISDGAESGTFPIGVAIEKYMTLCIDNREEQFADKNLYGAVLRPKICLNLDETPIPTDPDFVGSAIVGSAKTSKSPTVRVESIKRGKFTVTKPEEYGEVITLTAVDDMYKADKTYNTALELPQTLATLVRDACDTCDISLGSTTIRHGSYIVYEIPDNITFRTFFSYAAMIECANARIDINGYLQFVRWNFNATKSISAVVGKAVVGAAEVGDDGSSGRAAGEVHYLTDFISGVTFSSDDVVITGVKVKNNTGEYTVGVDGYVLEFQNYLAREVEDEEEEEEEGGEGEEKEEKISEDLVQIAEWLAEEFIGKTFRSMEGDLFADPTIEFGDMALSYKYVASTGEEREYVTPITDVSFQLSGYTTVKTQAEDPIRLSSEYLSETVKTLISAKELVQQEKTSRERAIEKLAETLAGSSGMYITVEKQPDGSSIYYMHNKPTLAESDIVWKLTAEAIAISTDGGATYPYGFMVTGDMITRLLYAEGIDADYINTGSLLVRDKDDNILFQADIDLKFVYIGGWYVEKEALYYNTDSLESTENGVYIGTDGMRFYDDGDYLNITSARIENGDGKGEYMCRMYSGSLAFYYKSELVGRIRSSYLTTDESIRGINIFVTKNYDYISLGKENDDESAVPAYYRLNFTTIGERTERHLFYGTIHTDSYVYLGSRLYLANSDSLYITTNAGLDQIYMGGAVGFHGSPYLYAAAYMNGYRVYIDSSAMYYIGSSNGGGLYTNGCVSAAVGLYAGGSYNLDYALAIYGDSYFSGGVYMGGYLYLRNYRIYLDSSESYYLATSSSGGLYCNGIIYAVEGLYAGAVNTSFELAVKGSGWVTDSFYVGSGTYTDYDFSVLGCAIIGHGSTEIAYLDIRSSNGQLRVCVSAGKQLGLYDQQYGEWIVRSDANLRNCLGNQDQISILYGSAVYLNGTTTAVTSDRSIKDNINVLDDNIDVLSSKLTPRVYTAKSDPERKHIGFVVDEVEACMKAAGYDPAEYGLTDSFVDDEGNELGAIRYDEFIPILFYEIQALREKIAKLEAAS